MALVRACSDVWHWQPLSRTGHRGKLVWCERAVAQDLSQGLGGQERGQTVTLFCRSDRRGW
jgi:hypothetical protein